MQVDLPDGRSFRLGGDAVVRLSASALDLERGQLIAWINPGRQGGGPLRVRTRVGTASIEGTTVFLEVDAEQVLVFSWEGRVRVRLEPAAAAGQPEEVWLASGEQLTYRNGAWQPPRRLGRAEARRRRRTSILLNGFTAAMPTLPVIEKELEGLAAAAPADGR
jgi:ferric-dicitrate binding protein FerR (iron transport regulator)